MGTRPDSEPHKWISPHAVTEFASPQIRMANVILSTLALLGCAFLVYVFFHWLRDELNPKKAAKPQRHPTPTAAPQRPYVVRTRHGHTS